MNHRSHEDTDHDMRVGIPLPMPLVDGGEQGEVEQLKGRIDALVFVIDHTRRRLLRVQAGEVSPTGEIMQIVDTLTRAVTAHGEGGGEGVARLRAENTQLRVALSGILRAAAPRKGYITIDEWVPGVVAAIEQARKWV